MNRIHTITVVLILAAISSGCTTKMDTYVHENNPSEYMELYVDQRYAVIQERGFCGTWRIHNDALHLYFNDAVLYVLQPDGEGYVDPDGHRWVKK